MRCVLPKLALSIRKYICVSLCVHILKDAVILDGRSNTAYRGFDSAMHAAEAGIVHM